MDHTNVNNDEHHAHDSYSHHDHEMHHHATHEHDMHDLAHTMHEGHEGHDHASGHLGHMAHMGNLKQKFWISLIITIPIILLSSFMGKRLPFQFSFPGSDWVVLILPTVLFFYGGPPFLKGAKMKQKEKNPAMMTLISMGITVAYIYSVYAFISNHFFPAAGYRMDFFWELATLIVIMLLGHWIEIRAVGNAGNALQKMAELLQGNAHLVDEHGIITDVNLKQIQIGQFLIVNAEDKYPPTVKLLKETALSTNRW